MEIGYIHTVLTTMSTILVILLSVFTQVITINTLILIWILLTTLVMI